MGEVKPLDVKTYMPDLVSVVMPAYNTGKYIKDSIESVLVQTYQNWELLIIDDASTDNTADVIASFNDSRIKYFKNEKNLGGALSRNRALREAKGKWIAFLDSDDIWLPEKLERQISFMQKNDYAFTFTDYRVQLNGKWLPYIKTGPNVINKHIMYNNNYCFTTTVMYNVDVIGLIQVADLRRRNDYAMWLKAIEKSNAYRLPECLSYYIKHDGSVSGVSRIELIKWEYLLFRMGQDRNCFVSFYFTVKHIIYKIIAKYMYRKKV